MDRNKLMNSVYQTDIARCVECIPSVERLRHKSVMVTGATGMIGSATVDMLYYLNNNRAFGIKLYLAGRSEQRVAERYPYMCLDSDYQFVEFDATTLNDDLPTVDFIIHCASNADPRNIGSKPVETLLSNIVGTKSLLNTLKKNRVGRMLFVSSSEVYGRKESQEPFQETDYGYVDILNPRACYPLGKWAGENLCVSYANEYGCDVVIARPGHIYGPTMTESDSRASSQFPRDVAQGKDIMMKSEGTQLRSYCYVLDCASALLTILLNGECGEAYNVSNKDSICTIRQMAEAFAKVSGRRIIFDIPTEVEQRSYNLMDNSSLDSSKLETLGWHGLFSMGEGAAHTMECLK